MRKIVGYLRNEQGIETMEWIAVGAIMVGVAIAVYNGTLRGDLINVVNKIGTKLQTFPS
jgi:hypothetical protein